MNNRPEDIDLGTTNITSSEGLEWMMQSQRITDDELTRVLVNEFYPKAYRLANFLINDSQSAREISELAILMISAKRHRYWGEASILVLICEHVMKLALKQPGLRASTGKTVHGKGLAALERNQALVILLKFGLVHKNDEIAKVIGISKREVNALLTRAYKHLLEDDPDANSSSIHPHARERIIRLFAGEDISNKEDIRDHLENCLACKKLWYSVENLERRLVSDTLQAFPEPHLSAETLATIGINVQLQEKTKHRGWRLLRSSKEVFFIGIAIAAIIVTGWAIGRVTSDDSQSRDSSPTQIAQANTQKEVGETGWTSSDAISPGDTEGLLPNASAQDRSYEYQNLSQLNNQMIRRLHPSSLAFGDPETLRLSGMLALKEVLDYWGQEGSSRNRFQISSENALAMPYELHEFVNESTDLNMIQRFGGSMSLLSDLTEAGYPVMIQRHTFMDREDIWYAQYDLVLGVDETNGSVALASYFVSPREAEPISYSNRSNLRYLPISYEHFEKVWLPFNYTYYVVYPDDHEADVMQILGDQFDGQTNYRYAADLALSQSNTADDNLIRYFSLFNQGTSLVYLGEYKAAAVAYDQAVEIFQQIQDNERPRQMLWYQNGPYLAYYFSGRFGEIITIATTTIASSSGAANDDSYFWRGWAREHLGDHEGAMEDLRNAIELNPDIAFDLAQLKLMNTVD